MKSKLGEYQPWEYIVFICVAVFFTGWIMPKFIDIAKTVANPTVATPAPVDASSPTSTVIAGEVVEGGMAVLSEPYGRFGMEVNGVCYPYARIPAIDPRTIIETWITHYGPPTFALDNCHTSTGYTPREALALCQAFSDEWGVPIDGFCAVSDGLPWYWRIYDTPPPLIHVDGHGDYLALDHKGAGDCAGIDVYEVTQDQYPNNCMYSEIGLVWEIK